MSQTIKDLWNGNIAPCEQCGSHDPKVNQLIGYVERHRENLSKGLAAEQMEIFQKYIDCSEEYLLYMLELAFCEGFSLGSKLAVEVLE